MSTSRQGVDCGDRHLGYSLKNCTVDSKTSQIPSFLLFCICSSSLPQLTTVAEHCVRKDFIIQRKYLNFSKETEKYGRVGFCFSVFILAPEGEAQQRLRHGRNCSEALQCQVNASSFCYGDEGLIWPFCPPPTPRQQG